MLPVNIVPFPDLHHDPKWDCWPLCGGNDGYVNLGAEQWCICRDHKMKWLLGENLFEGWQNQAISEYLLIEQMLSQYKEVLPVREKVILK